MPEIKEEIFSWDKYNPEWWRENGHQIENKYLRIIIASLSLSFEKIEFHKKTKVNVQEVFDHLQFYGHPISMEEVKECLDKFCRIGGGGYSINNGEICYNVALLIPDGPRSFLYKNYPGNHSS